MRMEKEKEKKRANNDLPREIIELILSLFPVKSLMRFRCVSKAWYALLDDPAFVDRHFNNQSMERNCLNKSAIFLDPLNSIYSLDFETLNSRVIDNPLKTWVSGMSGISFWGSCNGLVLITSSENNCLWNPATQKHKMLPTALFEEKPVMNIYGFGYNATLQDYEVVNIGSLSNCFEVGVYSVKRNSWRRIQDFPYGIPFRWEGAFTNGAVHWVAQRSRKNGLSLNSAIIAYDVGGESFRELAYPDNTFDSSCRLRVAILDGNLCLVSSGEASFELWVMKEYGARESWTKLFIIGRLSIGIEFRTSTFLLPLCFLNKGATLVLSNKSNLYFFELKTQTLKRRQFAPTRDGHKYLGSYCCQATDYSESLVAV
ncbi:hypothetical protein IFM89_021320 [Coptis chinensis]|uniref:F-box domain-containing protein n=1 Tax=Coptis chinensis TaxID=261450 RepID=A0A835LWP1_9MAGN|nr:hypothetical protein IFM89_021320 [Coptis chinensis]